MHLHAQSALLFSLAASPLIHASDAPATSSIHTVDLNGDGQLDLLENRQNGQLTLSLGIGARSFQVLEQELPNAKITDFLAGDFDGDGFVDLYLVTPGANFALRGDGTGLLIEATEQLGLQDEGLGQSAELLDLDADNMPDLLLHNAVGDVIFWAVPGGFERDSRMPFVPMTNVAQTTPVTSSFASTSEQLAPTHLGNSNRISERTSGKKSSDGFIDVSPTARPTAPDSARTPIESTPLAATAPGLSSASLRSFPKALIGLSEEQIEILSYLSIEELPDGLGGMVKALRVSGINLQIVNGRDATNGAPGAPDSIDGTVNGLGNLIVGYNELGNPNGDDRSGSHNLIIGHGHSYQGFGGLVAGHDNFVAESYSTVSAGQQNLALADHSSVSGGSMNTANIESASVSGGIANLSTSYGASISGGSMNTASADHATVSGGLSNVASGIDSAVSGGMYNLASAENSSIGGGLLNRATGIRSAISGGHGNVATGVSGSVSGGFLNTANGLYASISGGKSNTASGDSASVSGGLTNRASGDYSGVSGGSYNLASNQRSVVSGGQSNTASGQFSSVSGGWSNVAQGNRSSVTGGDFNLASGVYSSISGGRTNTASGSRASVSGGESNHASGLRASISGGISNLSNGLRTSISGGRLNTATGAYASVSGGQQNRATGSRASVSGGLQGLASGTYSSITGGQTNTASGSRAVVSGGATRTATGSWDWIGGGYSSDY